MTARSCPGSCCEAFFLDVMPDELHTLVATDVDGPMLFGMLIPLWPDSRQGHWYTCANLDPDSKLCRVYDKRPRMCRDYPGEHVCSCGLAGPRSRDGAGTYTPGRGAALCFAQQLCDG